MGRTNVKVIASTVVIVGILVAWLLALYQQNASLHRQLADLESRAPQAVKSSENRDAKGAQITGTEMQRLRKEHLELLSLRGRITQLAREQRNIEAGRPSSATRPDQQAQGGDPDSILFTAALTNRVISGHTLVVGGWAGAGLRSYFLITPNTGLPEATPDGKQIAFQSQVIRAPESFWDQVGWNTYKSDRHQSTLAGLLTPDQVDSLLAALKGSGDAHISNTSSVSSQEGRRVGFAFSIADEQETGLLMDLNVIPRLTADGKSLDLELQPAPLSPKTVVHSSVK